MLRLNILILTIYKQLIGVSLWTSSLFSGCLLFFIVLYVRDCALIWQGKRDMTPYYLAKTPSTVIALRAIIAHCKSACGFYWAFCLAALHSLRLPDFQIAKRDELHIGISLLNLLAQEGTAETLRREDLCVGD